MADQTTSARRKRNAAKSKAHKIETDEFHPDPRIAAQHADRNARLATVKRLKDEATSLAGQIDKTTDETDMATLSAQWAEVIVEQAMIEAKIKAKDEEEQA